MNSYYFTFGIGHELQHFCLPVVAKNYREAEKEMFRLFGKDWAFGYEEGTFNKLRKTTFKNLTILNKITVQEVV